MQRSTRSSSFAWSQALKKSTCMVEYAPEASDTVPRVVGMGYGSSFGASARGMGGCSGTY